MAKDPSTNEDELHKWATQLLDDGRSQRRPQEAQWYENLAAYLGDFWSEFDPVNNKLMEPNKPSHKVRLPVNLAQPAVRTEYAKLLKNRPIVDCMSRSSDPSDLHSADVGDKLLNHYIEKQLHMPKARRRMLQWVVICGCGGLFVDYDPAAMGDQEVLVGPDGQPVVDQSMISSIQRYYRDKHKAPKTMSIPQGELRNRALAPFQYVFDFSSMDVEDAWWCIISEIYDVDEVYSRWEVEVEGADKAKLGVMERRLIEKWDLSSNIDFHAYQSNTQKLVEVNRLFVRPGHRYFPDGGEVVFTDGQLIASTNFPFKHGMLPLGVCGHVPMPLSQYSMSVIPAVKPLVLEVSKTESQLIENRNLMSNPIWLEYRQNRVKGEIQNKPGVRLTVDYMPNVPEPHPVQMPEMPAYVQNLIETLKEHILEVTGQSEVSQGKVPAGARAGVTIAYLQEEDDTKMGPTVQEYEECIERVAWLQLQVIAEKYDAPRTIRIYRKHSEPEVFDFIGTMLEGVAGVVCQAGSALPRSKAAKQQFVLDLWDRKLEQDPRRVREMLELDQGEDDDFEVDINQAERENRKMLGGQAVQVQDWHNHAAHHYAHRRFMKSPEFDDLDPEHQQLFVSHDEQHTAFERQDQQRQAINQMLSGGGSAPASSTGGANGNNAEPQGAFAPQPNGSSANVQDYQPQ